MKQSVALTGIRLACLLAGWLLAPSRLRAQDPAPPQVSDTLSIILIDADMREDWPDHGVVGFHRENNAGDLTVNFSVAGTALPGTDYTSTVSGTSITIPDGDREAGIEFVPTGATLTPASKTIIVNGQGGTGYVVSGTKELQSATVTLGTPSPLPNDKAAVRFLLQAAFGPDGDFTNVKNVEKVGFDGWIKQQFAKPVGRMQPYLNRLNVTTHGRVYADAKAVAWWGQVMSNSPSADPLRQRVGFALSELFVDLGCPTTLGNEPIGMSNYYDLLLENAFGNLPRSSLQSRHAPGDGCLSQRAAKCEGRCGGWHLRGRELCARGDAALLNRHLAAQSGWNAKAG